MKLSELRKRNPIAYAKAITNTVTMEGETHAHFCIEHDSGLSTLFMWDESPEGASYWAEISEYEYLVN